MISTEEGEGGVIERGGEAAAGFLVEITRVYILHGQDYGVDYKGYQERLVDVGAETDERASRCTLGQVRGKGAGHNKRANIESGNHNSKRGNR